MAAGPGGRSVNPMERFTLWLERFGDAWRHRDPDAVTALFAPGARYQDSPFAEPLDGVEAILDYWRSASRHSGDDVEFHAEVLAFDEDAGIAHWHAEFTAVPAEHHVALDGILLATLDAQGRCTDLREWWHRVEEHG